MPIFHKLVTWPISAVLYCELYVGDCVILHRIVPSFEGAKKASLSSSPHITDHPVA